MNEVVGYDEFGDKKFPRFSGPCKGCGATNYGLSTSGPDYCGACACGIDPEVTKVKRALNDLMIKYLKSEEYVYNLKIALIEARQYIDNWGSPPNDLITTETLAEIDKALGK